MQGIDIPAAWEKIEIPSEGVHLIIGAPDTGKSTFARYLYQRAGTAGVRAGFLDGDPGQSTLGPPTTMTLALPDGSGAAFPPQGRRWASFIGAVSPRGHMLPTIVGAARLVRAGSAAGAQTIVYDTSGLVDPAQGGVALKWAKIDLLRPTAVYALQRNAELEPLLIPLRRSRRAAVIDVPVSSATCRRDTAARQAHRAARFREYFQRARLSQIPWTRWAVVPAPRFALNRLIAMEDRGGFVLGLGIVLEIDRPSRQITLLAPPAPLEAIDLLRLGDLQLDPNTFRDRAL